MSDKVKMPAWLPMSRVLENLGWNRSRLGPGLKGTVFRSLGAERKSNTCTQGKAWTQCDETKHHCLVSPYLPVPLEAHQASMCACVETAQPHMHGRALHRQFGSCNVLQSSKWQQLLLQDAPCPTETLMENPCVVGAAQQGEE